MRILPLLLAVAGAALLVAVAAQANQPPRIEQAFPSQADRDLVLDQGHPVRGNLTLSVTAFDDSAVVHASTEFVCESEGSSFVVDFTPVQRAKRILEPQTSTRPEKSVWTHNLSLMDPRLVTCNYKLFFRAHDQHGRVAIEPRPETGRDYEVNIEANPQYEDVPCPFATILLQPPSLCLVGFGAQDGWADSGVATRTLTLPIRLREGEVLSFNLSSAFPQMLTYEQLQPNGVPLVGEQPFTADSNRQGLFTLRHGQLVEGPQQLIVRAYSRVSSDPILVLKLQALTVDRTGPLASAPIVPLSVHRDVEFPIVVRVRDPSSHQVTVKIQHKVTGYQVERVQAGTAQDVNHTFAFTLRQTGDYVVIIRTTDALNNRVNSFHNLTVLPPETRLEALKITLLPDTPLGGELLRFSLPVAQTAGHLPVDFDLVVELAGESETLEGRVGTINTTTLDYEDQLPAGRYTINATVIPPPGWTVREGSRLTRSLEFEVYMGAVVVGNQVYWIRANEKGLPGSAVRNPGERNETIHNLDDVQNGTRVVWTFEAADGRLLTWDPLQRNNMSQAITTVGPAAAEPPAKKDSPGLHVAVLAASVGALALARRRRAP